jgi:hypothetical protein
MMNGKTGIRCNWRRSGHNHDGAPEQTAGRLGKRAILRYPQNALFFVFHLIIRYNST